MARRDRSRADIYIDGSVRVYESTRWITINLVYQCLEAFPCIMMRNEHTLYPSFCNLKKIFRNDE